MLTAKQLNQVLPYLFDGEIDYIRVLGSKLPKDASVVMLGIGPALMAPSLLEGTKYPIQFVGIDNDNFTGVEHLCAAGFDGLMKVVRGNTHISHTLYQKESIDLLLVDACHRYECVKQDILGWWPKVRVGGIVFFHDYVPLEPDNRVKQAIFDLQDESWELLDFVGISAVYRKK